MNLLQGYTIAIISSHLSGPHIWDLGELGPRGQLKVLENRGSQIVVLRLKTLSA